MAPAVENEFDRFSNSYNAEMKKAIGFCPQEHEFFTKAKARCLIRLARRHDGDPARLRILDVGCGTGLTASLLAGAFHSVTGIDVSAPAVSKARESVSGCDFRVYDGQSIPADDNSFDLVFSINVFHHVAPAQRMPLLREMRRVAKIGGIVLLFEHNPYNPLTMRAVRSCAFDTHAILLKGAESRRLLQDAGLVGILSRYILFLPFFESLSDRVDRLLGWLPAGAQHYSLGRKA